VTLYARFAAHIDAILNALEAEGSLAPGIDRGAVAVEPTRDPAHGDLATNAAMVLAKRAGTNPRALAALIVPRLAEVEDVASAEAAGPGFINIRLNPSVWQEELGAILAAGADYGRSRSARGSGSTSNMSRPTRPGRCTWAIAAAPWSAMRWPACSNMPGYAVTREYYVNDAGGQVDTLARSVHLRYRKRWGRTSAPSPKASTRRLSEAVGAALAAEHGDRLRRRARSRWLDLFRREAVARMILLIKADLAQLGVHHDLFASERRCRNRERWTAPWRRWKRRGWSIAACWSRLKAKWPRIGSRSSLPCFAPPVSATIRTARSGSPTAAGPILPPMPLIIFKSWKRPTS
jgi:arginyl-tRNA synthetase